MLSLIIGPIFGMSTLHFPLYVVEALLVELVAWRMNPNKPLTLGVVAGALIGTVGFAAEWGWSHLWMPLPWPSSIFPEGAILALVAGVAGGMLGGFIGRALLANGRQAPAARAARPARRRRGARAGLHRLADADGHGRADVGHRRPARRRRPAAPRGGRDRAAVAVRRRRRPRSG